MHNGSKTTKNVDSSRGGGFLSGKNLTNHKSNKSWGRSSLPLRRLFSC